MIFDYGILLYHTPAMYSTGSSVEWSTLSFANCVIPWSRAFYVPYPFLRFSLRIYPLVPGRPVARQLVCSGVWPTLQETRKEVLFFLARSKLEARTRILAQWVSALGGEETVS